MQPIPASHPPSAAGQPGGFALDVRVDDSTRSRLRARGELDLASAPVLAAALDEQLQSGRRYVHVDLSDVTFCDTTGLAALAGAHHAFLSRQGSVTLIGVSARIRRLLVLTGLDHVLFAIDHGAPTSIGPAPHKPARLRARIPRPVLRVRRSA